MDYVGYLQRNVTLYTVRGLFERRAYLPIITIYATTVAGVSLAQIGLISAITAFMSLVTEVPSGYISDKMGHKKALLLGSFLQAISVLAYIIWQNFFGACAAMVIFWMGVAFHSGTLQAFVHETLIALGRDDDFAVVSARERRYAMAGNIILVALVPLTYQISPILPFVIGFFLHACAFVLYLLMTVPQKVHQDIHEKVTEGFFSLMQTVWNRKEFVLFFFIGTVTAAHNKMPEFREIYFQNIGVPLWFFGFILSITGLITIFFTYGVPRAKNISTRVFYGIDFAIVCVFSMLIWCISQPVLGVMIFIVFAAYRRVRSIVINAHLLAECPTQNLKATYLSLYEFFGAFSGIFVPLFLGGLVGHFGLQQGYAIFGIGLCVLLLPLYLVIYKNFTKMDFLTNKV